jgi:hypothetical protein
MTSNSQEPISEKQGFIFSLIRDALLLFRDNKALLILVLVLLIAGSPLAAKWRAYRLWLDQEILYNDPRLIILEGENIRDSNANYWFDDEKGNFLNKYLILYTKTLPSEGYIFFRYKIEVPSPGIYKLFLAGNPPGTKLEGFNTYYCPFEVWLDNKNIGYMYEETYKAYLRGATGNVFYYYYEYMPGFRFTKLGELALSQGDHELEFRIYDKPLESNEYNFKIDTLFLVPSNWKPKKPMFSLPNDLFSY